MPASASTTPTPAHPSPSAATAPSPPSATDPQAPSPSYAADTRLTPLEAALLDEYALLRDNLDKALTCDDEKLSTHLATLAAAPAGGVADGLRALERQASLVCTALKASVYGIVLQQQIEFAGGRGEEG